MPHLSVDGTQVHYRESGEGPPVIFTHGGGSSGAQWRKVCELLAPRFRTITVDHFGHGGTGPWPGAIEARRHEDDARLVRAVMDHAGEPAHLVGHSFGGGVVLRLVLEDATQVRSMALLEPMAVPLLAEAGENAMHGEFMVFLREFLRRVDAGQVDSAWEEFMEIFNGPGSWKRMPHEAKEKILATTPSVCSGTYAIINHATTLAECAGLALPALLLHGELTHPPFIRLTGILAEHIPAARLEVIPGAGHMSPLTHPAALAELLAAHLEAH